jgi:hypothetical protein
MDAAIFLAIFVPFVVYLPLIIVFSTDWRAAEDRARARRLADARMNARLLRLNI